MKHILHFVISLSAILWSSSLFGQWNAATDLAVCAKNGGQAVQEVISDNNGGVWVIWSDSLRYGLQHLDSNGYALGPEGGVLLNDSLESIYYFRSAYSTDDGSLRIAYSNNKGGPGFGKVAYLQHFDQTCERTWGPYGLLIVDTLTRTQYVPTSLVHSNDNGCYISLQVTTVFGSQNVLQRFDSNGNRLLGDNGVPISISSHLLGSPNLFEGNNNGVYVAFPRILNQDMMVNYIDSSGSLLYPLPGLNIKKPMYGSYLEGVSKDYPVKVTYRRDSVGKVGLMVYSTVTMSTSPDFYDKITVQVYDSSGLHISPDTGFISADTLSAITLAVIPDDDGSYIRIYKHHYYQTTAPLYVNRYSYNGDLLWNDEKLVGWEDTTVGSVSFASNQDGISIVWDRDTGSYSLYAQLIDTSGAKQWGDDGTVIGEGNNTSRTAPVMTRDESGNCIVCWTDSRNKGATGADVYCAKVLLSGEIATVMNSVALSSTTEQLLYVYPNPTQGTALLASKASYANTQIKLVDILGRVVYENVCDIDERYGLSINLSNVPEGTYTLIATINGKNYTQQIVRMK